MSVLFYKGLVKMNENRYYLGMHSAAIARRLMSRSNVVMQLDEELREIRKRGVAVDLGGLGEGIVSVAVAVRDYSGKIIGAITLIVPAFRIIGSRLENEIIPSLKEGADLLSGKFGYCPA